MKKTLALVLVVLMMASLFAGCVSTPPIGTTPTTPSTPAGETPYPVGADGQFEYGDIFADQTVEIWCYSKYDIDENSWLWQQVAKKVGCKIKIQCWDQETYRTKINTAMQTNRLPDIAALSSLPPQIAQEGDMGRYLNLSDPQVVAKMPNFNKYVQREDLVPYIKSVSSSETGNLYIMPGFDISRGVTRGWMYRKDIFDKHGIQMWTNNEEFKAALRKLKELYPESYPWTESNVYGCFQSLSGCVDMDSPHFNYDYENGVWEIGIAQEEFWEMLCLWRDMYNEKILDPNSFTQSSVDLDPLMINGNSFVSQHYTVRMTTQNAAGRQNDPNFCVSWANNIGNGKFLGSAPMSTQGTIIMPGRPQTDAAIAIMDWFYSDIGAETNTVGIEGDNYEIVDGKRVYDGVTGEVAIENLESEFGMFLTSFRKTAKDESPFYTYTPEQQIGQELLKEYGTYPYEPPYLIKDEISSEFQVMADDSLAEVQAFLLEFITKNGTRERWEEWGAYMTEKYAELLEMPITFTA